MANSESAEAYITRAKNIATKCASLGQVIQTRELVYYVVRGLNSKLENIASVLRPQRSATLEEIQQALSEEETRLNESGNSRYESSQSEKAFKARERGRGQRHNNDRKCFVCGKVGHIAKNCWHRKEVENQQRGNKFKAINTKNQGNTYFRKNEHAKIASENEIEHDFKAFEENAYAINKEEETWNLDSGCTSHMTPYLEWMTDLENVQSKVNLAEEGRYIEVKGKGNVKISTTTTDGEVKHICVRDVLYVPSLRTNLLSVRSLINHGNKVIFDTEGATILNKEGEIIAEAKEKDRMYVLEAETRKGPEITEINCMNVQVKDKPMSNLTLKETWHKRLGHLNEDYLENMQRHGMVRGLNINKGKMGVCESCIMGKLAQTPFKAIDNDGSSRTLEIIHMDLCGPMPQESLGGAKYLFVLVDSYSRRIFVEFLKSKNEAFLKFVEFKNKRENEVQCKIQNVRTDNGTEFVNNQFVELFKNEGIKHQKTTPYTPQSNGVAERANRTLLEKARTMLIDSNLPNEFWAEAVATAAYVQNCTPTKKGGNETPMQKWSKRIPTVKHMRIFGSVSYYYIPKNLRNKFEPKAKKGIFVGYSRNRKAYRIFDPQDRKIHEVRTVKFVENMKGGTFLKELRGSKGNQPELPEEEIWTPVCFSRPEEELIVDETQEVNEEIDPPVIARRSGRKAGETLGVLRERHQSARKENEERLLTQGVRRSERIRAINQANMTSEELTPTNYQDTQTSPYKEEWEKAMDNEMNSLSNHEVWKLVTRKPGMKVTQSKWIYTIKKNTDGTVDKRKARLVAAGYNQRAGIDFEESFSPVMKLESFRLLMAIAAHKILKIRQYDVQTAYLHGEIKENVFMEQPCGYIRKGDENKVCELQKSIYGLPQSGRYWNEKLNKELLKCGLTKLESDPCVYIKQIDSRIFMMGLYVDDLITAGSDDEIIDGIMGQLKDVFVMTEKLEPDVFLGIQVNECAQGITLSQEKYIETVLERFGLSECNPSKTPGDTR